MSMLLRKYHEKPSEPEPKAQEPTSEQPAKSASRKEWAEYAVSQGQHPGSLEELTKKEIQSLFE